MNNQPEQKHYRILKLTASNVKRLRAVEILPSGNVITIGGKNDQGKSSLLDAILYAMAGQTAVCEQPIRHGASKAEVTVDLGDLVITKTFVTSGAPKLKVTTKDGAVVTSPQAILDQLCSKISYDPMEWLRMKPDKQLDMLRQLVGVDFGPLNGKRQKLYDERTLVNRDLSQKKAKLATMPEHPDAPAEEVSVAALMQQLTAVQNRNLSKKKIRDAVNEKRNRVDSNRAAMAAICDEILELKNKLAEKEQTRSAWVPIHANAIHDLEAAKLKADEQIDEDTQTINTNIIEADTVNSKVRDNQARKQLTEEIGQLDVRERAHTSGIEAVDQQKQQLLKDAKFPLPGLSFDDSGVLLDNVPFGQAGMAKKIRASVAIGLALNPKLRVILIRDGSLLDEDSMKLLAEMAEKEDAQVWIECVGTKDMSVVIEDGNVKEV